MGYCHNNLFIKYVFYIIYIISKSIYIIIFYVILDSILFHLFLRFNFLINNYLDSGYIMLEKLAAWNEIFHIGLNTRKLYNEINIFYKSNVLRIFKNAGLFEYLKNPHTFQDILTKFNYIDKQLLSVCLNVLVSDYILISSNIDNNY